MMQAKLAPILSQINALEAQLGALKAQVKTLIEQDEPTHTFADLKGLTGGQWNLSEEEIDAALYRMTPEFEEEIATIPKTVSQ